MTVIKEFPSSKTKKYVLQFGKPGSTEWYNHSYFNTKWWALFCAWLSVRIDTDGDSWRVVEK
jgi:hypothetical protein